MEPNAATAPKSPAWRTGDASSGNLSTHEIKAHIEHTKTLLERQADLEQSLSDLLKGSIDIDQKANTLKSRVHDELEHSKPTLAASAAAASEASDHASYLFQEIKSLDQSLDRVERKLDELKRDIRDSPPNSTCPRMAEEVRHETRKIRRVLEEMTIQIQTVVGSTVVTTYSVERLIEWTRTVKMTLEKQGPKVDKVCFETYSRNIAFGDFLLFKDY